MRKSVLWPAAALLLGGVGAALRMWQLSGYVDGLPPADGPASILLAVLLVGAAALFLVWALGAKNCRADGLTSVPSAPGAAMYLISALLTLLAGVFTLAGVLPLLSDGSASGLQYPLLSALLGVLLAALTVPAVISMFLLAKDAKEGAGRSRNSLMVLFPVILCWVWLIDLYRSHTSNPVLWDYLFLILGVVALLLAAYYRSGFSFREGKPRAGVFTGLCALFFAPISMTTVYDLPTTLRTAAMVFYTLAFLTGLLRGLPGEAPSGGEGEEGPSLNTEETSDE